MDAPHPLSRRMLTTGAFAACVAVFSAMLGARAGGIGPALLYTAGIVAAAAILLAALLARLSAERTAAIGTLLLGIRPTVEVLLLGLVMFEATSRFAHAPPVVDRRGATLTVWRHSDPLLGWVNTPSFSGALQMGGEDIPFAFNQRGFRDIEQEPDPNRPRVVILGDSYPIGWGGPYTESVAPRLRTVLPEAQIFNAACTGYAKDQMVLTYPRIAADLRPDVVVLMFMAMPGRDRSEPFSDGLRKPWFELDEGNLVQRGVPVRQEPDPTANRTLYRQFEADRIRGPWTALQFLTQDFPRAYLALGERLLPSFDVDAIAVHGLPPLDPVEAALLADLRQKVEADGARLVVTLAPDARILTRCADPVAAMRPYLASYRPLGIDPLDITPLVAADWRACYNSAMHPNGTGVDRLRETLAARIRAALAARAR